MFCCGAFLGPQQDCFLASNACGESDRLLGIRLDRVPAEVALCTSETEVIRSHVVVGGVLHLGDILQTLLCVAVPRRKPGTQEHTIQQTIFPVIA